VIDVDERDRWDRNVKRHKATIEELTRQVAELTAQVAALLAAKDQGTGDGGQEQARKLGAVSAPAHSGDRRSPGCDDADTFGPELGGVRRLAPNGVCRLLG